MFSLKKKAGFIVRGAIGFLTNFLEKTIDINDNVKKIEIGKTVKGNSINVYLIGDGEDKVLFVSAIHGNEVGTVKLAYRLIDYLEKRSDLKNRFSFFIIPCLNVDGYNNALRYPDYFNGGNIGRLNTNNVDLNRNFDTPSFQKESVWSYGKNYQEKKKVFCGKWGNSEPEIQALTKFIKNNNIKIVYFFHNAGKDVMGNNNEVSQKLTKIYCQKTGFRYISDDEWKKLKQTGTAKEWCEMNNIAYIEVECSNRWGSDWRRQKEAIISII
jgi:hypothetical protein